MLDSPIFLEETTSQYNDNIKIAIYQQREELVELWWAKDTGRVWIFWGEPVNGRVHANVYNEVQLLPGDLPAEPDWEKLKASLSSLITLSRI